MIHRDEANEECMDREQCLNEPTSKTQLPKLDESSRDQLNAKAITKAVEIHMTASGEPAENGILVFLTTPAECEVACEDFEVRMQKVRDDALKVGGCVPQYQTFALHGRLQADEQNKVFQASGEPGVRKVIFATNLAETSVTIKEVHSYYPLLMSFTIFQFRNILKLSLLKY